MHTLAEHLKSTINQQFALEKIIDALRSSGEWGGHGLFAKIGKEIGVTPAYVGRVLAGRNRLTETFVAKIADYLGKPVNYFVSSEDDGEVDFQRGIKEYLASYEAKKYILEELKKLIDEEMYCKKLIIPKDMILTTKPSDQLITAMSKVVAYLEFLFPSNSTGVSEKRKIINSLSARTADNFNKAIKGEKPDGSFPIIINDDLGED